MDVQRHLDATQSPRLWPSLPLELRCVIYEKLKSLVSPSHKHTVADWTRVSKEWRGIFEPLLWQTLTFRPPVAGFEGFSRFATSSDYRKAFVKRISLHFVMDTDKCDRCNRTIAPETILVRSEKQLIVSLETLVSCLASWTGATATASIELEVAISWTGYDGHEQPPRFCCLADRPASFLRFGQVARSEGPNTTVALQAAPIVGRLSIKGPCPSFLVFDRMTEMTLMLPSLQQVSNEQRFINAARPAELHYQSAVNRQMLGLNGIRKVSLWTNPAVDGRNSPDEDTQSSVDKAAVSASFHLKELAISSASDAESYFSWLNFRMSSASEEDKSFEFKDYRISSAPEEVSLEYLVLTHLLGASLPSVEANQLLIDASLAASMMPHLKMLELWSPGIGPAYFFRCEIAESQIRVTMGTSWEYDPMEAAQAWEQVAEKKNDCKFEWWMQRIEERSVYDQGSGCKHLKLGRLLRG
ncbi:hypothetical protein CTRI78_v007785 [Colletotrichum trifolii]|uniref:DUF6546 domain-containing protein n=1 Tax=Colletotrichum trifolii TaxID=5466 RepID=A0A4R8R416_COLTR|nr:hypothetical protein CTRI78_v007785 [Colletotrichum trifolii]